MCIRDRTDAAFEDAVVAVDADFADVDAEIGAHDFRQIQQNSQTVDAAQFDGDQIRHRLVLRPFDLLLDDIPAELGRKTVQFVARGFVDDDVAGFRIAVTHDLVSRNRFAAFRYLELGRFRLFFGRVRCIRRRFARVVDSRRVVALLVLLFVDEKGPELEYLAFGVYFQDFVEVLQVDDAGSDLAVQLLLVVAFVYRDDLAQDTAAELDVYKRQ